MLREQVPAWGCVRLAFGGWTAYSIAQFNGGRVVVWIDVGICYEFE